MPKVTLRITQLSENPHPEDVEVSGDYLVTLNEGLDESVWANAALDVLHSNLPIKVLEDYSYVVFDYEGSIIESDDDIEGYSMSTCGCIEKL